MTTDLRLDVRSVVAKGSLDMTDTGQFVNTYQGCTTTFTPPNHKAAAHIAGTADRTEEVRRHRRRHSQPTVRCID